MSRPTLEEVEAELARLVADGLVEITGWSDLGEPVMSLTPKGRTLAAREKGHRDGT